MILEHLCLPRKQYEEILPLMKSGGDKFYNEYVDNNYQFETENNATSIREDAIFLKEQ